MAIADILPHLHVLHNECNFCDCNGRPLAIIYIGRKMDQRTAEAVWYRDVKACNYTKESLFHVDSDSECSTHPVLKSLSPLNSVQSLFQIVFPIILPLVVWVRT